MGRSCCNEVGSVDDVVQEYFAPCQPKSLVFDVNYMLLNLSVLNVSLDRITVKSS